MCSYHDYECLIYRLQTVAKLHARNKKKKCNCMLKWLKSFSGAFCTIPFESLFFFASYVFLFTCKGIELYAKGIMSNYDWAKCKMHLLQVFQPVPRCELHVSSRFSPDAKALDCSTAQICE